MCRHRLIYVLLPQSCTAPGSTAPGWQLALLEYSADGNNADSVCSMLLICADQSIGRCYERVWLSPIHMQANLLPNDDRQL